MKRCCITTEATRMKAYHNQKSAFFIMSIFNDIYYGNPYSSTKPNYGFLINS